jgi:hypothetical protein
MERRKKKIGKGREGKVRGREKVKERRRGDVAGRLIIIVFHGTRKNRKKQYHLKEVKTM